jgi:chromosomal replication initiation ATPase DnaA
MSNTDCHVILRAQVRQIITVVAAVYGVSLDEVLSLSREQPIVYARQLAMYIARHDLSEGDQLASYPRLGRAFGRDHSTVIQGVRETERRLERSEWRELLAKVRERLPRPITVQLPLTVREEIEALKTRVQELERQIAAGKQP